MASILARQKVVGKILDKVKNGYKVLVVVSAMGRRGDPYATDTLIEKLGPIAVGKREMDLLLSCGEIISAVVLANQLHLEGYQVPVLSGQQAGILTDANFGDAEIIDINPKNIRGKFKKHEIILVAGFQGASREGDITTLARGGSDISAIALGQALNAGHVEIYTDVEGVMTADPSLVKDVQVIRSISYEDLHYLAKNGARVVHPKAVKMAEDSNLPLMIKNTFSDKQGTLVTNLNKDFKKDREGPGRSNLVKALTYEKGKVLVSVHCKNIVINDLISRIIPSSINIDFITWGWDKIILVLGSEAWEKLKEILESAKIQFFHYKDSSIIYFLLNSKENKWKVFENLSRSLGTEDIPVLYLSDISDTFWCLIRERDMEKALNILHNDFILSVNKKG